MRLQWNIEMKAVPLPSIERIKELLDYDPTTGLFTWKPRPDNHHFHNADKEAGYTHKETGYVHIKIDQHLYLAHRIAWAYMTGEDPDELDVDHKNRNKSDNWFGNLRLATTSENKMNHPPAIKNTSGFRGVYFHKQAQKWVAKITKNYKTVQIGSFNTIEEAANARYEYEKQLFGAFTSQ